MTTRDESGPALGTARMRSPRMAYAVWEITLRCNLACIHCGSRAGSARPEKLSTEEALDLVGQVADVGITDVTLLGGEAFLRRDWSHIAQAITAAGMRCSLTTGAGGSTRRWLDACGMPASGWPVFPLTASSRRMTTSAGERDLGEHTHAPTQRGPAVLPPGGRSSRWRPGRVT